MVYPKLCKAGLNFWGRIAIVIGIEQSRRYCPRSKEIAYWQSILMTIDTPF